MASKQDDDEDTSAMAIMLCNKTAAREAREVTQAAADDDGNDWGIKGGARGLSIYLKSEGQYDLRMVIELLPVMWCAYGRADIHC